MLPQRKKIQSFIFATLFIIQLSSCVATEKATYFSNVTNSSVEINRENEVLPIIQRNDILSIYISSLSPEASAVFNTTNTQATSTSTTTGSTSAGGYLVNAEGTIQLPILGNIKAEGLTKQQLKTYLTDLINEKKLLIDPVVTIRHLNYEVTVIGEVGKPTVINVPNEKISMLKALGIAGDITIYGKKENVLLIREIDGKRIINRIDLNSKNFLSSPYYYLQPNDVLYVEPNEIKIINANRNQQLLPTILSALSIVAVVITSFIRN
jgi:polysaccharide export outer membrane protein